MKVFYSGFFVWLVEIIAMVGWLCPMADQFSEPWRTLAGAGMVLAIPTLFVVTLFSFCVIADRPCRCLA